ncbi:hypothetical protein Agub_g8093, partial [Astrephomene gubernaculifera]
MFPASAGLRGDGAGSMCTNNLSGAPGAPPRVSLSLRSVPGLPKRKRSGFHISASIRRIFSGRSGALQFGFTRETPEAAEPHGHETRHVLASASITSSAATAAPTATTFATSFATCSRPPVPGLASSHLLPPEIDLLRLSTGSSVNGSSVNDGSSVKGSSSSSSAPSALSETTTATTTTAGAVPHVTNSTAAAATAVASCRRLCFTVPSFATQPGQQLVVVGGCERLGRWRPADGLLLTWHEGHRWRGEVELQREEGERLGKEGLEFKVVMVDSRSRSVLWEPGRNRVLQLPTQAPSGDSPAHPEVLCEWGNELSHVSTASQQQQQPAAAAAAAAAASFSPPGSTLPSSSSTSPASSSSSSTTPTPPAPPLLRARVQVVV